MSVGTSGREGGPLGLGLRSCWMGSPWEPSRPDPRGLTVSPCREPDSTYFDLPQPGRGRSSAAGSAGDSLDVFHMQGMTSPVMVSWHGGCTSGHSRS